MTAWKGAEWMSAAWKKTKHNIKLLNGLLGSLSKHSLEMLYIANTLIALRSILSGKIWRSTSLSPRELQ